MAAPSMVASVGWSVASDASQAGTEAAKRARATLPDSPQVVIAFGSSWFDQGALVEGIRSVVPEIPIIGGTTAGEITPDGPMTHSCVVLLITANGGVWSVGAAEHTDHAPREAGQQAGRLAVQHFRGSPRVGFLLVGDGLVTGFADVVRGLQEALGTSSLIAGGMAADDLRFTATYQYTDHKVLSRGVVGVLIGGTVRMGIGLEHGFAPISRPRRVTRAQGNLLFEVDRQPAAVVYEEYVGPELARRMRLSRPAREGLAYPLGLRAETSDAWLLRNVIECREDGALACSGEITEGAWVHLMVGSRQLALDAAQRAAQQAVRSLTHVACAVVFDSVVRRHLLGQRYAAMEIATIREALGSAVPVVGCYTYGEQGPVGNGTAMATAPQTGAVLVVALGT